MGQIPVIAALRKGGAGGNTSLRPWLHGKIIVCVCLSQGIVAHTCNTCLGGVTLFYKKVVCVAYHLLLF